MTRSLALAVAAALLTLIAPAAAFAGPGNDDRDSAANVERVPGTEHGTLGGAGVQDGEDASPCAATTGSVWYRFDPGMSRRVVVHFRGGGDLDAAIDVFARNRSQQDFLTCDASDRNGNAAVSFDARKGQSYLVRVARRQDSASAGFTLDFANAVATPSVAPDLPSGGVGGSLDRADRVAETWAVSLIGGVRYRFALDHGRGACLGTALLAPGESLGGTPLATLGCEGYALYTPEHSGRYTLLVHAANGVRGRQRYRLAFAAAGPDDTAPGLSIDNYARRRGALGGVDRVDLYRFDVVRRSVLFLHLRRTRHFALELLTADGRRIGAAVSGALHKGLHRGRYFIAVRSGGARGRYTLLRASRTITKSHVRVATPSILPGAPADVEVFTQPPVSGPVTVRFEQFDPLAGWQYAGTVQGTAVDGLATVRWTPPSVGRWRATATYDGTKGRAPSVTGFAPLLVAGPLHD